MKNPYLRGFEEKGRRVEINKRMNLQLLQRICRNLQGLAE